MQLKASAGLDATAKEYEITQLFPATSKTNTVAFGGKLTVDVAGASAVMLQVSAAADLTAPKVLGVAAMAATLDTAEGALELTGITGEIGTAVTDGSVFLPESGCGEFGLRSLVVNGVTVPDATADSLARRPTFHRKYPSNLALCIQFLDLL